MNKEIKKAEDMSVEELQDLLKKKNAQRREQLLLEKQTYEQERDQTVQAMVEEALELHKRMVAFKAKTTARLESFRKSAQKYGDIRSNSKGGFSLRHSGQRFRVSYDRNTKAEYDERAALAEELLKEFLEDQVKKKDLQTFRTINALMTRNKKTGDFNPTSINSLIAIEDNYQDERWRKAIKLFKESYQVVEVSMSVSFYQKDEAGKDQLIPLSLTSL